ncbi:MAG TPA: glycerophosphodiester phosphodiesterase family protein [Candidatus Hydrogenedentes bacterium]|nr:glycerophosphodiester phosphodiesterase family protein [Candidatus Hydrogenedentota bacterium]
MLMMVGMISWLSLGGLAYGSDLVQFQAHRGGLKEAPENTLAAYRYAWDLGGIPEVDICATADNVIICLHDDTLHRTTNASENEDTPVGKLTFEEIRRWDAGIKFDAKYTGEKVPRLEEVFQEMSVRKTAQAYLDLKKVDLEQLAGLIRHYDVAKRLIFCHNKVESCRKMRALVPGLRAMLWIGGEPSEIQQKFRTIAAQGFEGLDQVQVHLKPNPAAKSDIQYLLPETFLQEALKATREKNIDFEVLPFQFDCGSLSRLLKMGIRWYATDEPKRFKECAQP